jgi:hypothetical protein
VNDRMGLSLIAEVMGWPSNQAEATQEYAWLRMMSSVKYNSYSFFRAGVRFIETLATWLKQFERSDRPAAYRFGHSINVDVEFSANPRQLALADNMSARVA